MTEVSDDFKAIVSAAIAAHFTDAPTPDGTTETNREHIRRKEAVCDEVKKILELAELSPGERSACRQYVEERAQGAIYDLFPKLARKPKRYK
jgi:hypothetical protein